MNDAIRKEIGKTLDYLRRYPKDGLPSIAICILTKDSFGLIHDCVRSIEALVRYPNSRIVVFDTGTTDAKTLQFYADKKTECVFPFSVLDVGPYQFSKNYNDGIRQIDADYVFIQNNDTLAINDYVSRLMRLAIIGKVGICGPRMLFKDGSIQHDAQILYLHRDPEQKFASPTHLHLGLMPSKVPGGIHLADGIAGAGLLIRRDVYWQADGFNEAYLDILQDVELNVRVRMLGYSIACDRDAQIFHFDHGSRGDIRSSDDPRYELMMLDTGYYVDRVESVLEYRPPQETRLGLLTLVDNLETYSNFLDDLSRQDIDEPIEIVAIPNFNGEYQDGPSYVEYGKVVCESQVIARCPQDLRVPSNWLRGLLSQTPLAESTA